MNIRPSKKYGLSPEEVERKRCRVKDLEQRTLQKVQKFNLRQDRYDKQKKTIKKRKKLRENLEIGEKVYVLTERIKKKSAPGKSYKESVQNISYFYKDTVFSVRKKQIIDNIMYY